MRIKDKICGLWKGVKTKQKLYKASCIQMILQLKLNTNDIKYIQIMA